MTRMPGRAFQIAVNLLEMVEAHLNLDVAFLVRKRVTANTSVFWCSRMHMEAKKPLLVL